LDICSFYAPFFDTQTGEDRKRAMKKWRKTGAQNITQAIKLFEAREEKG